MNKAQLIEALTNRLGDKRAASAALDAVLAEIQAAVTKGDRVAITGFGAFEKRVRGARTARNPRTGEAVKVKKTSVPAFRAGAGFKEMVASGKVPKATPAKKTATKTAAKSTAKTTSTRATKSTAKSAAKSTAAKKTTAKKAPAKAAKTTRAATTRATTTRATARTTATAKAPTARRGAAKR